MAIARTLTKNVISTFIIRFDLDKRPSIDFLSIVDKLKVLFPKYETQVHPHFNVNLDNHTINSQDEIKYRFRFEEGFYLVLSPIERIISFESNHYTDKSIYESKLLSLIGVLKEVCGDDLCAMRIGMRYVNDFPCSKSNGIPLALKQAETKYLKEALLSKQSLSRIVVVEEYSYEDCKVRVQFGIVNKFYPSVITRKDLVLDIDVFSDGLRSISEWDRVIEDFNHTAFDVFVSYIREDCLESLK